LKFNQNHSDSLHFLGVIYHQRKEHKKALELINLSIKNNSNNSGSFSNRGLVLIELKQLEDALSSLDTAIKIDSRDAKTYNNRALIKLELNQLKSAIADLRQALKLNPNFYEAYTNLGNAYKKLKHLDASLFNYDKSLKINPKSPDTHLAKARLLLLIGDLNKGLIEYEWRYFTQDYKPIYREFLSSKWTGHEKINGKTILLYSEQGLGDTIQFCRYIPLVNSLGAKIILEVDSKLIQLLRPSFNVFCEIIPIGTSLHDFDFHCSLLSLPLVFDTSLSTIPSSHSYLSSDSQKVDFWKSKINSNKFSIGINWQGSQSKIDAGRSFPVSLFKEISLIPNVRLISLQKNFGTEQLENLPSAMKVETLGDDFDSGPDAFIDTAALMKSLDLVITSDTSIAHLAGALGVPTWVALQFVPDWRWLLDRSDSPWYPSIRLFRQKERDNWNIIFKDIKNELLKLMKHE
jgi:lipoprotein NlpI